MLVPTERAPDGSKRIGVPSMVAAGPPAEMVVDPMVKEEGLGVNAWPAMV